MDQNRRKTYEWKGEIDKKTDLQRHFTPAIDALRAVYSEGYGEEQDKSITHERSVYFVKQAEGLRPFAVIVDRLTADKEHDYEVLWSLDAPKAAMNGLQVRANTLNLIVPEAPMETAGLSVSRGVQFPEWQGWRCNSTVQKDFRPIFTAQYWLHAKDIRWATVLYADHGEACPITAIGEEALRTFRELGHMTVKFDGAAEAAQPGVMHVRHDGVPPIVVGSVFAFQKGEKDRKHHIFKLFQKGRKNLLFFTQWFKINKGRKCNCKN
jgi:hypothetical protein